MSNRVASLAWGVLSEPWQGQLPGPSWRAWDLVVVEAQSLGVGVEEGGPFQAEEVVEEGPCPVVEEVGVEVRNQAGGEVVEVRNQAEEEVVAVQNLVVVVEEEGEGVVDKIQAQVRAGEAVVEVGAYLQRLVVEVEGEVAAGGLDGCCPVASAGTCRQSSL